MNPIRPVSKAVMARYKRAAGLELTDEERIALRDYERPYDKSKMALYVPEKVRTEWTTMAAQQGLSVSEWARTKVAEAVSQSVEIKRLEALVRDANAACEQARTDLLRHAQQVEVLKRQLDDRERDYAFLLRRTRGNL